MCRRGARIRREYVRRSRRRRSMCRGRLRMSRNRWVNFFRDIDSIPFRHPETLTSRVTVRRQLRLSAPYFGPPASHTRIPDRSLGRYSSPGNQRQKGGHRVMSNRRRARSTEKGGREQSEERTDKESQKRRSQHCGTIHHRVTEAPKGAQYGTLKIPLSAKVTNDESGRASEVSCLGWGAPQYLTDAFFDRVPGARSTDKQTAPQNGPTGTQGPSRSANKLQMTFRNSTRFPEGRFSGRERLPASLRGTPMEDRDHNNPRAPHNDLRAPQDI
ncbi:hypothetical protein CDL15_Pgr027229 [Punica granatum]|uniref:Uncharacterized protein n=1 Tax=Punica granatum TaxID=22663 RepID=A0A218VY29_PUNGR|nr:hypothetical protein CDL15_Pgr027229 [Punica granatum]